MRIFWLERSEKERPRGVTPRTMVQLVGAIDQGTQSTRFILYDENARVVAKHQKDVKSIFPKPGWAEQDPREIYESVEYCASRCLDYMARECAPDHTRRAAD